MSGRLVLTQPTPTSSAASRLDSNRAAPSRCPPRANMQTVRTAARSDQFAQEQSGGRCAVEFDNLTWGRMSSAEPHHPLLAATRWIPHLALSAHAALHHRQPLTPRRRVCRQPGGIGANFDASMADSSGQDAEPVQLPAGFREEGLAYYEALKETLGRTHVKAAGFLTGYLFLTASSDVRVSLPRLRVLSNASKSFKARMKGRPSQLQAFALYVLCAANPSLRMGVSSCAMSGYDET